MIVIADKALQMFLQFTRQAAICPKGFDDVQVREFQKSDQKTDAAGAMVWLHSLRAQGYPELRIKGRELWSELSRGSGHVRAALFNIENMTQKILPELSDEEIQFVPGGLEPFS
jgi:hypothetical protein